VNITVKTLFGLEQLLAEELTQLGARNIEVGNRVVLCEGDQRLLYSINLKSRLALRALVPILSFRAHNETVLYKRIRRYNWTELIDIDQTFAINSAIFSEIYTHSQYISLKVKDAINDQFRDQYDGRRPSIDLKQPDISIDVHCVGKDFTISLDSSGSSLHRRGYRQSKRVAPLNEVLASGMIMASGWNADSPLYDPMCGSGTLLIEAYNIGRNIAPGSSRDRFAFMNWPDYDAELWDELKEQAEKEISNTELHIYGSDINGVQINETIELLTELGYQEDIRLKQGNFTQLPAPYEHGTIVTNPPYDERIKSDDIIGLYKSIGDTLKEKYDGWDAWILSGNKAAIKRVGLRTSKKLTLYNRSIECKYHKYEMYRGSKKTKNSPSEPA
jgi:putative N6-adenine-specific DNA methylase